MEIYGISFLAFLTCLFLTFQTNETKYTTSTYVAGNYCDKSLFLLSSRAIILKATTTGSYTETGKNCLVTIVPRSNNYGVIAYINKMNIRTALIGCKDYVQIQVRSSDHNKNTTSSKFCTTTDRMFTSKPYGDEMVVNFYRYSSGGEWSSPVYNKNFEIILTQYKKGYCGNDNFECDKGYCIDKEFKCDNINNCGDNSDEYCGSPTGAIVGGIIGGLCFIAIIIGLVFCMRRRRTTVPRTRIMNPVTIYQPNSNSYPPQVYLQGNVYPQQVYPQGGAYPLQNYPQGGAYPSESYPQGDAYPSQSYPQGGAYPSQSHPSSAPPQPHPGM